jgi:adenosylcobalamin-dependent ribonucleoside-triphosphate reductase
MGRQLAKGMGEAVAKRTVLRTIDGVLETWDDVAKRVALGNVSLLDYNEEEYQKLYGHITNASLLMSGRHLQHGDKDQHTRNMEVFTNCSTAASSFLLFYLLLNGSGVGRAYDSDLGVVNWDFTPVSHAVLSDKHPDFKFGEDQSAEEARRKYKNAEWHMVDDSREGWAKVVEILETLAYEKIHKDRVFVFDFSNVRAAGTPIGGMQDRPASGPRPTMRAIQNVLSIKGSGLKPWEQAMWVDHYLAECVLVGGARRSARMSTKYWKDEDVIDFINIKRGGFLWSSNNSITVDEEFWKQESPHAQAVLKAALEAAYNDGTGEPGFINQDKLVQNNEGLDEFATGDFVGSKKYQLEEPTKKLMAHLLKVASTKEYSQITNPCGEISLHALGGYCVIADVVPYYADNLDHAEEAFRVATRALMRVNTMDSLYAKEVTRTNRIGVGITGLHEFAWKFFGLGFRDMIDESKSADFWATMKRFSDAVKDEAKKYAEVLGVNVPHTDTTIKPAGTTSKLFGLTEGAHLPSMKEYIRWVQFRNDDPLVKKYEDLGYPIKKLKVYHGSTAVGFPTQPEICKLGMGDRLVTAGEATPEEQYKYLMLLEKYWIGATGNQVSYTLKYVADKVSFEDFAEMITKYQSQVRCCSVMPQGDATAYEYQPEEPVTIDEFIRIAENIKDSTLIEDIDLESLKCASGACPI